MTVTKAKDVTSYVMKYYPWSMLVDNFIKKKYPLHLTVTRVKNITSYALKYYPMIDAGG